MTYWKCLGILEMMKISLTEFNYGEKCYWESFQYKVRQFVGCLWRIEWGILIIDIENFTHGANSIFSFTINPPKTGCMPFFYRFIKSNRKINDNRTTKAWIYANDPVQHCVGILQKKLLYNCSSPGFLPNQIRLILFHPSYNFWMLHHFLRVYLRIDASGKTGEYFYIPNHDLKYLIIKLTIIKVDDHFVLRSSMSAFLFVPFLMSWSCPLNFSQALILYPNR